MVQPLTQRLVLQVLGVALRQVTSDLETSV